MRTLEEMIEQLKQIDEVTLVEILNLTSEDLIDRCRDLIEANPEKYALELQQWFPEDEDEIEEN